MSSVEVKNFLTQKIEIRKKFSNDERHLYNFFFQITNAYPDNVIIITPYVFFFGSPCDIYANTHYTNKDYI